MVPDQFRKPFDWDQPLTDQGTWPTMTVVNTWYKNETTLATMIRILEIIEEEIKKIPLYMRCHEISARLEMSLRGSPW